MNLQDSLTCNLSIQLGLYYLCLKITFTEYQGFWSDILSLKLTQKQMGIIKD
jgi:hypothetical protein